MMKRKIIKLLLSLCVLNFYFAQNTIEGESDQVIRMPNAEVATLGKFIDAPVSLSKGIPNIDIPLYSINAGDYSFPISLNYYAAGVKIDDIASWVGLGWKLSGEGAIVRQQRGNPDENLFFNSNTITDFINGDQYQLMLDYLSDSAIGDYETDVFTFNFANHTGKFIYDQILHKFINNIDKNFKLEFITGTNSQWKVTDNLGDIYFFTALGKTDTSYSINGNMALNANDRPTGPISWKLTKIITNKNKEINFYYQSQFPTQYYQPPLTSKNIVLNSLFGMTNPPDNCVKSTETTAQLDTDYTYSLEKIVSDDTVINFIWSTQERLDSRMKSLQKLEIRNKNNDLIKTFEFTYSFIHVTGASATSQDSYRMYLDQIDIRYPDNHLELYRQFHYTNRQRLPQRLSSEQDYWGLHNNKPNLYMYPQTYIKVKDIQNVEHKIIIPGGNRRVDSEYSQDGLLNRIVLPTKGEIKYTYENNWIEADSLDTDTRKLLNPFETTEFSFYKNSENAVNNSPYRYQFHFTVPDNPITINSYVNVTGCSGDLLTNFACHYQFAIHNDNGIAIPWGETPVLSLGRKEMSFVLPPGNYILGVKPMDDDNSNTNYFSVNMEVSYEIILDQLLVGGLRVKKIEFVDSGTTKIEKRFNYNYFDSEISSGKIQSIPSYLRIYSDIKKCKHLNSEEIYSLAIAEVKSIPFLPLYDESGDGIHYTNVTEETVNVNDPSKTLKTEYIFSYEPDQRQSMYSSKNVLPPLSFAHKRGNLLEKREYNKDGSQFKMIQRDSMSYTYNDRAYTNFYIGQYYENGPYNKGYATGLGYTQLDTKETKEFFNNDEVSTTFHNIYDMNSKNLTSETITSALEEVEKRYVYADSRNQLMTDHNMSGILLEKLMIRNSVPVSRSETNYPLSLPNTQTGNLLLPVNIQSTKLNTLNILNPTGEVKETEVTFDRYDDKGNLLQYTTKYGTAVTVIWGYSKTQPIAKIEGAHYDDIKDNSLIATIVSSSYNDLVRPLNMTAEQTERALIEALDNLRQNSVFQNFRITTYTYDPLIGVRSITPPSGIRENYIYDSANRLEKIVDMNGRILKEYQYQYKK